MLRGAARFARVALALGLLPVAAAAQLSGPELRRTLAEDGRWAFHLEVDEEVRVCERGIWHGDDFRVRRWGRSWDSDLGTCSGGQLEVRVTVVRGEVEEIETGAIEGEPGWERVGRVAPEVAVDWLLALPAARRDEDVASTGWMVVNLAELSEDGRRRADVALAEAVRDRGLPTDVRETTLFWASVILAERVSEDLRGIVVDDDERQSVREHAVFALSQLDDATAVPLLMELSLDAPHAGSREQALFWLAQRDTPEVVDFFADLILRGGSGG